MRKLAAILVPLQLSLLSHLVHSMINFFISQAEMDRTLGLNVQLNYIENGTVNLYSVNFPYRININVSYVQYSWNTKVRDRSVHYAIRAASHDSVLIPLLHIPSRGKIPLKTETFTIEYRCAGVKAGKFDIQINFNFDWPSSANQTKISLKQEKLCTAREVRRAYGTFLYVFNW
uniref:WIF domain-containing protein n=1 Tax=Setaria digitata TaxID=48799 RepID=A0A915PVG9_9BILA